MDSRPAPLRVPSTLKTVENEEFGEISVPNVKTAGAYFTIISDLIFKILVGMVCLV
jgi:hypothetical protein